MSKTALVTGVQGQDGAYLAQLLIQKGYRVVGTIRKNRNEQAGRLNYLGVDKEVELTEMDLAQPNTIYDVIEKYRPDEIYNLAAVSYISDGYGLTKIADVNALGVSRMLDTIRSLRLETKFFHASSSQIFGTTIGGAQDENTPFAPQNPYGITKLFGHLLVKNCREAHDMFACSGILYNHESPLRGKQFVTKKIIKTVAEIKAGVSEKLSLGNINVARDWGFAGDYVKAMWLMLQQEKPSDYVIASGKTHTLRYLVEKAFSIVDIQIDWKGEGLDEVGRNRKTGKIIIDISPQFFRPIDVLHTLGDATKARVELGWQPKISFDQLIELMLSYELDLLKKKIV